jgi:hypothetical protein
MRARIHSLAVAVAAVLAAGCSGSSSSTPKYSIGGTVAGLAASASVVLQDNGGDDLTVTANGAFTFTTKLAKAAAYAVTVKTQPAGQQCTVAGGSGTVTGANVTSVAVTCKNAYSIGGTVAGLSTGNHVVLHNGADNLTVSANGTFTFATKVAAGDSYAVSVLTLPTGETCAVTNGAGTVGSANVTNVQVTCEVPLPNTYAVGGSVTGLTANGLQLHIDAGAGESLSVPANATSYTFGNYVANGSYHVTVATDPTGFACTVANGGSVVVSGAAVTTANVTCARNTFSIGGTVSGLPASTTVVLQDNGADNLTLSANGAFTFATQLATGSAYAVTVLTQPSGGNCKVIGSGTVNGADVTSVGVTCATNAQITATVQQRWTSPATWGPAWVDDGHMIQHATFNATTLSEAKGVTWGWQGSFTGSPAPEPTPHAFGGWPSGTIYSGGPFPVAGQRYQASGTSDSGLDFASITGTEVNQGDMLVCAIIEPYFDPIHDGDEYPIIAKGVASADVGSITHGGWVLGQSHESFLFSYQVPDSGGAASGDCGAGVQSHKVITYHPTQFAGGDPAVTPDYLSPLNTSYVVVCGGREGSKTRLAVNSVNGTLAEQDVAVQVNSACPGRTPAHALDASPLHATIGGYAESSADIGSTDPALSHPFPGRVYETAVWAESATPENIEAKLMAVQGLDGTVVTDYSRNREGPYVGADSQYHTSWRHSPRLDPAKGMLFGLQGWNRVSYWMPGDTTVSSGHAATVYAAGEDLKLWATAGGASVADDGSTAVPGDGALSGKKPQVVTLPAGGSISIALDKAVNNPNCLTGSEGFCLPGNTSLGPKLHTDLVYPIWDAVGPIQGQLWVRVPSASAGTLRVRYQQGAADPNNKYDIDLSTLSANAWKRVYLNGTSSNVGPGGTLSAADTTTRGTLYLENPGASPISFNAWGIDLTQIGGSGDAAYASVDPGVSMYDWTAAIDSPGENGAGTVTELTRANQDALTLVTLASDPSGGFCLAADAQPVGGLPWSATMRDRRTLLSWSAATPATASLYVNGTGDATNPQKLCFELTGSMTGLACAAVPAAWEAGSLHNVKGCVSTAGQMSLYNGDTNTQLGTTVSATGSLPALSDGHLLVGNSQNNVDTTAKYPWHGYVSRALICNYGTPPNACQ